MSTTNSAINSTNVQNLTDNAGKKLGKNDSVVWRYADEDGNQIEKSAIVIGFMPAAIVVLDYNNQYAYASAKNLEKTSA